MDIYCPFHEGRCEEVRCGDCPQRLTALRPGGIIEVDHPGQIVLKPDAIHPQHYSRWKMEPIEFIAINDLPWWLANVIKYGMRYDAKDGLQDLYKARSYLDMKIRKLEGHDRFWEKPVAEERAAQGRYDGAKAAEEDYSNTVRRNAQVEGFSFDAVKYEP